VKRALILTVFAAIASLSTGCAATYTNIHKNEDGSYLVTRTKAGFIRMYGTLFQCTPQGETMVCKEIDSL
jgi:hypothetical protein